jgi:hypothetical protein
MLRLSCSPGYLNKEIVSGGILAQCSMGLQHASDAERIEHVRFVVELAAAPYPTSKG